MHFLLALNKKDVILNCMNKLTCLFGYHSYTIAMPDRPGWPDTYLCGICQRQSKTEYDGWTQYIDYDSNMKMIYIKNTNGHGEYDDKGNLIGE